MYPYILASALVLAPASPPSLDTIEAKDASPAPKQEPIGLTLGLSITSIVNNRGINLLSVRGQGEHQLALVPTLEYSVDESGLYVGYMGVFKVAGNDMNVGTNALQLLRGGWRAAALGDELMLDAGLRLVLFPNAEADMPTLLEPVVSTTWTGPLTFSLSALYSHPLQAALAADRYLYLQPRVSRSFGLNEELSLETHMSLGYKVFGAGGVQDRALDVATQVGVGVDAGPFSVTPAVNLSWVDINDLSFDEEYMAWASLGLGLSL